MQLSFRWYGLDDPVSLSHIQQIPCMQGIVTSLKDVPLGDVWSVEAIQERKNLIAGYAMHWNVVESLPVHEEIKWGGPRRDELIEKYQQSIHNIGKVKIPVVCYNFMPICDWMRTKLHDPFNDGSTGLSYYQEDIESLDLFEVLDWKMPAWASLSKDEIKVLQEKFSAVDEDMLRKNLEYFLKAVIPVAEESNVKMGIHPDDPPWSIFGLPRVVKNKRDLQDIVEMVDSPSNGITFCTGSLGASRDNNLEEMIVHFGGKNKIHFAHTRNVEVQERASGKQNFREVSHPTKAANAVNLSKIIRAYKGINFNGPMRPDHGRVIWREGGTVPGYGLYDRALGAMYLQGLWDA